MHRCPTWRVFSGTGRDLVTRQATIRYLYHSVTSSIVNEAQWWSGSVSRLHTPGLGLYPRSGQARFSLSSLQWVDK
ncbi:hypothetical protein TNCV_2678801 [Trichonephila clavipes]|nr:hypothetical protein TNCV_2678801 [Trichonephila clavipes]